MHILKYKLEKILWVGGIAPPHTFPPDGAPSSYLTPYAPSARLYSRMRRSIPGRLLVY